MRLAGEVADIALVGGRFLSADLADTYRVWLAEGASRSGRTLDDFETAPPTHFVLFARRRYGPA